MTILCFIRMQLSFLKSELVLSLAGAAVRSKELKQPKIEASVPSILNAVRVFLYTNRPYSDGKAIAKAIGKQIRCKIDYPHLF